MIGASFSKIKIDLSPNLSLPSMVRFLSFGNKSSCATGFDRETPVRAAGEALERQIAFSKNIVDCKKVNIKTLKPNIRDWSYKLFNQSKNLTDNYSYDCVEVFDTQDNSKALAPFIFFTLSSQPDDCFFPNRDSSGSAVHINSKDAINSAINEFIERQSLSLFWYYNHISSAVKLTSHNISFFNGRLSEMMKTLLSNGIILIINISSVESIHTYLSIYLSENPPVYFSAGCSGHGDYLKSLEKSLIELYQAYILMRQLSYQKNDDKKYFKGLDEMTLGYFKYNNKSTISTFRNIVKDYYTDINSIQSENSYRKRLDELNLLIFNKPIEFQNERLFYAKVHGINCFPKMTIYEKSSHAEASAALNYGYKEQVRFGSIPFA